MTVTALVSDAEHIRRTLTAHVATSQRDIAELTGLLSQSSRIDWHGMDMPGEIARQIATARRSALAGSRVRSGRA